MIFQEGVASANGQKLTRYKLSSVQNLVIGRHPQSQIWIKDDLSLVSGRHTELEPVRSSNKNPSSSEWQIRDLNSTNHTYVNNKRLEGWHTLQTGDQIFLGSSSAAEGSTTLIFECHSSQPKLSPDEDESSRQLFDCNILCLVVNTQSKLSIAEKYFIEQVSKSQISKLVVIVAMPGSQDTTCEPVKSNLAEIDKWIESQSYSSLIELTPLLLNTSSPSSEAGEVEPENQARFAQFCKSLEVPAKGKTEEMLIQRITDQLLAQISLVESIFNNQELKLKEMIQQEEEKVQTQGQTDLKEQIKKALRKVSDDKDLFFKQVKNDVSQSKAALVDEFRESSILHETQQFVSNLSFSVTDKAGYRTIRLNLGNNTDTSSVHMAVVKLCQTQLGQWATSEWKRICYSKDGLQRLLQRSYITLNFIPSLNLPKSSFQLPQKIDVRQTLEASFAEPSSRETRYKQLTPPGYLLKNFRGQLIPVVMLVGLFGGIFISIKKDDRVNVILLAGLIPLVFVGTIISFNREKAAKMEEETQKLKDKSTSYYQSLAKSVADRLVQKLSFLLEEEERRFRESLEAIDQQYNAHLGELEKSHLQLKVKTEKYKLQLKNLDKENVELQKLKRL